MDSVHPSVTCEICQVDAQRWGTVSGYEHYRCEHCGQVFVHPKPAEDALEAYYRDGTFYDLAERQEARLRDEAAQRVSLLTRLCRRLSVPMRLLDVGCANGYFISAAEEAGWDAHGVERSEAIADRIRSRFGAKVHLGVIEKLRVPEAPFPVVTAWEVLEHARDPVAFLGALTSNLSEAGILALSTPLSNGVPARLMGMRFPMLTPPEHLSLFSRKSLNILATRHSLREIHFRSFSNLDRQSLSSGLSRMLLGQNLALVGRGMRALLSTAALGLAWMPMIIDRLGLGSEMLVVFRKVGP